MLSDFSIDEKHFIFDASHAKYLKSLIDNGMATLLNDGSVELPFENIYELTHIEREFIGLPDPYPFELFITTRNVLFTPKFFFEISFRTFSGGDILPKLKRQGPLITLRVQNEEANYLLSLEQFRLVNALETYNELESKRDLESYRQFAEIKELSKEAAANLDETLKSRQVLLPENISIDFNYQNDELEIIPRIQENTECNKKFIEQLDNSAEVKERYSMGDANGKTIVVLDAPIQEELKKIKKIRKTKDPKIIKEIIENPEAFFDSETDISVFYSDRVIGKGLYEPKVYPFISPYKSQWIPGFESKDRTNGTTHITIKNAAELTAFKESIDEAEREDKPYSEFRGAKIPIDKAKEMWERAKEILLKKEPVARKGPNSIEEKKKNGEVVLLIEENVEQTGYDLTKGLSVLPKQLELETDPFLFEEFQLKNHQREGVAWLQGLVKNSNKGALLADDMGLGKTLQILYLLDWHSRFQNVDNKPYLIVAPVSLLENWCREYERFFKDKMPIEIVNPPKEENKTFIQTHSYKHIMVVGYEKMRIGQLNLGAIDFASIVLDEAQKIKTPGNRVTNAAKALKSDFRVAMTGTPIENTYVDLWCIMDFAVPGLLGNAKEFTKKYQKPLKDKETDIQQLGNKLRKELGGLFLRRLKSEIRHELPEKHVIHYPVLMPKEQSEQYKSAISFCQKEKKSSLENIHLLKKICDHPFLDRKNFEAISVDKLINTSAKLSKTVEILEEIREKKEKVILFTEYRDMQRMLQKVLLEKFDREVSVINGDSSITDKGNKLSRQKTIDIFQAKEGFNVIIMSPTAAGIGLNVTAANHVIHYTRHWNPAKENQATDRVYRIGQTQDVFIHYPITVWEEGDSFDVVLDELLKRKTNLAEASLYPTDRIEVIREEVEEKLFGHTFEAPPSYVKAEDVQEFDGLFFEAFIAIYYEEQGYETRVTSQSGDNGVDVLAFGENINKPNLAIQCKHSSCGKNIGSEAVSEVLMGQKVYGDYYQTSFEAVVITNSSFSKEAKSNAKSCKVQLLNGESLMKNFKENTYLWEDVERANQNREPKISK